MSDSTLFALALDQLDGVGRVTAGRLLTHFATYDDLLRFPREQVLTRIKGAPNAAALVARLFDRQAMQPHLDKATALHEQLAQQRVEVLTPHDADWPNGFDDLPRGNRPFLLYSYGYRSVLAQPLVALFAEPPLSPEPFEQAQALVRHLLPHGIAPATGAANGFDIVVHKLCYAGDTAYPSLLVAHAGMAKAPASLRPTISMAVRGGGLFVSPFEMQHGPFAHDERERTLLQATLADACVFFEPKPDTPAWHTLTWAIDAQRPVFGVAAPDHPLPEQVHPIRTATDFDWVLAAIQESSE